MNLLIDYCPESLERLTDRCGQCGRQLRWRHTWGIGHCDDRRCHEIAATEDSLPEELAEDYRLFCDLVSPIASDRDAAIFTLSAELQQISPIALTDLCLGFGAALETVGDMRQRGIRAQDSLIKARIVANGAACLRNWPDGLRQTLSTKIAEAPEGGRQARQLLNQLRATARVQLAHQKTDRLFKTALPEIFTDVGRVTFDSSRQKILGSVAARRLVINHSELKTHVSENLFSEFVVHEGRYKRALYLEHEIDAARIAWRTSTPVLDISIDSGLPLYAVELIVAYGDIEREQHPFVLARAGQPRAKSKSAENYLNSIQQRAISLSLRPEGTVPIEGAMKVVGGRLKPWRHVLKAIRDGELTAWLEAGDKPPLRRMFVMPSDLIPHVAVHADYGLPAGEHVSSVVTQLAACEILNVTYKYLMRISKPAPLQFTKSGKALVTPLSDLPITAAATVSPAEAGARLMVGAHQVSGVVRHHLGRERDLHGWARAEFDAVFGNIVEPNRPL